MPIEIRFENPPGTLHPSLLFDPGQPVRVTGTITTDTGGWAFVGQGVDLVISDGFTPLMWQSNVNVVSNYWFDITLPNAISLAEVRVTTYWPFGYGAEERAVTIGIGTEPPPPPPQEGTWDKLIKALVIGGAVIGGLYFLIRGRKKS